LRPEVTVGRKMGVESKSSEGSDGNEEHYY
jgi:hypothetical protein